MASGREPIARLLGDAKNAASRVDRERQAATWDSGEGAFQVDASWDSAGVRAVYRAFDPTTAILNVVAHKGSDLLDTDSHTLTGAQDRCLRTVALS